MVYYNTFLEGIGFLLAIILYSFVLDYINVGFMLIKIYKRMYRTICSILEMNAHWHIQKRIPVPGYIIKNTSDLKQKNNCLLTLFLVLNNG